MEDLKALTECAECTWDYIDRLRMALASACKERDELKKELAAMRNELCYMCGKYREAHNGACDGCRWKEEAYFTFVINNVRGSGFRCFIFSSHIVIKRVG